MAFGQHAADPLNLKLCCLCLILSASFLPLALFVRIITHGFSRVSMHSQHKICTGGYHEVPLMSPNQGDLYPGCIYIHSGPNMFYFWSDRSES